MHAYLDQVQMSYSPFALSSSISILFLLGFGSDAYIPTYVDEAYVEVTTYTTIAENRGSRKELDCDIPWYTRPCRITICNLIARFANLNQYFSLFFRYS